MKSQLRLCIYGAIILSVPIFMFCSSNIHSFPNPGEDPYLILLDDQIYDVWTPQSIDRDKFYFTVIESSKGREIGGRLVEITSENVKLATGYEVAVSQSGQTTPNARRLEKTVIIPKNEILLVKIWK